MNSNRFSVEEFEIFKKEVGKEKYRDRKGGDKGREVANREKIRVEECDETNDELIEKLCFYDQLLAKVVIII
ncbi:hypothetical protein Glove_275g12 [Diversispora epigaea]|uniref:Uncharacterized protein n=1 Tax=Diversispora epigaea TaxID=1348612 RepID=A0A397I769_9GLOM|nr:hypothetical protein Glove_275g12 [Diversispora epigaea]